MSDTVRYFAFSLLLIALITSSQTHAFAVHRSNEKQVPNKLDSLPQPSVVVSGKATKVVNETDLAKTNYTAAEGYLTKYDEQKYIHFNDSVEIIPIIKSNNNSHNTLHQQKDSTYDEKTLLDNKNYSTNFVIKDENIMPDLTNLNISQNNHNNLDSKTKLPLESTLQQRTANTHKNDDRILESDNLGAKSMSVEYALDADDAIQREEEVTAFPSLESEESTRSTLPIEMLLSSTAASVSKTADITQDINNFAPTTTSTPGTGTISTQDTVYTTEGTNAADRKNSVNIKTTTSYDVLNDSTTKTPPVDVITSKRGGFIDLATKTKTDTSTKASETTKLSFSEKGTQMFVNDQNINEELLIEKTILEKQDVVLRHPDKFKQLEPETTVGTIIEDNSASISSEKNTDPELRVQPIVKSLYEVNNNYKKMKKIKVQPAKPFVRDPDDNTWRNESLSSMGIVFKAKNSTKSFTEVIKSKTENEFNNLSEEDLENDNLPGLRDRLEQLAEQRKSKKKKTGISDESINQYNHELLNILDSIPTKTPSNNIAAPSTNSSHDLSKGIITTIKPKLSFMDFNEDELDYAFVPHIDIKKSYKKPLEVIPPKPVIQPVYDHIDPNRKPTIQYFPPKRDPVSVNQYDANFENKMSLLTDYYYKPKSENIAIPILSHSLAHIHTHTDRDESLKKLEKLHTNDNIDNYYAEPVPNPPRLAKDQDVGKDSFVLDSFKDLMAGKEKIQVKEYTYPHIIQEVKPERDLIDKILKGTEAVDVNMANKNQLIIFPVLYNNSVIHASVDGGGSKPLASSSSFQRRDYSAATKSITRPNNILHQTKIFDANDDKFTLDLALPAHEFNFFVPEQELAVG